MQFQCIRDFSEFLFLGFVEGRKTYHMFLHNEFLLSILPLYRFFVFCFGKDYRSVRNFLINTLYTEDMTDSNWTLLPFDFRYDLKNHHLYQLDQRIFLTPTEQRLFDMLIKNRGRIVRREELTLHLWNTEQFIGEGTLTTSMSRLRKKIGNPHLIKTIKGIGYWIP